MRRCTTCFRYSPGHPTFCNYCGRSYNVRICARGHINTRSAQFCAECGSEDLSTPSAPESFLSRLAHWSVLGGLGAFLALVLISLVVSLLASLDWSQVAPRLAMLLVVLGVLYWASTLLPGPVKKVGRAAAKTAMKAVSGSNKDNKRR